MLDAFFHKALCCCHVRLVLFDTCGQWGLFEPLIKPGWLPGMPCVSEMHVVCLCMCMWQGGVCVGGEGGGEGELREGPTSQHTETKI